MNDSGEVVSKALNYFSIQPADLLVVHDDVDLEALQFKVSRNSSSAGHRGVQNIIDKIGTQDFTRLRVGVGRLPQQISQHSRCGSRISPPAPRIAARSAMLEKYVLQDFSSEQLEVVKKQGIEHLLSSLGL
jgi:peptidyl-tRNA hydrolase